MAKNPPGTAGDGGSVSGSGRSLEKEMAPHSSFLPGKSHGHRSPAGYSPQSRKRVGHHSATEQ